MSEPTEKFARRPKWLRWLVSAFLIVPMFPLVVYRAIKLANAQDGDDPEDLIVEIHKMNRLSWCFRGKNPYIRISDRAKIAEARVLQNRLEEAHRDFASIRNELKNKKSEQARYVRYYCGYWLANIRGDFEQAEYELRQAAKLSYRSSFLSLPVPKGQDPLDIAFDHELLEAAEAAGMTVEEFVRRQVIKNRKI